MLLTSPAGDSLELRITGYESAPSPSELDPFDDNWLLVAGRVKDGTESWSFHDPCLLAWEARSLLTWLREAGRSAPRELGFLEPNLSFVARPDTDGHTTLVVTLRGEAAPPDISDDARWNGGRRMSFPLSPSQMVALADAWERDLTDFPVR